MDDSVLIRCRSCGALNRVPRRKIAEGLHAVCGQCKVALSVSTKPLTLTDSSFTEQVERSPVPVLVDLWAEWCGPCRMMAPLLDELAVEMAGRVQVAKLNVDENPAIAARFGVQSIPTLLVLKAGREVDRMVGVQSKTEIMRRLQQVMGG